MARRPRAQSGSRSLGSVEGLLRSSFDSNLHGTSPHIAEGICPPKPHSNLVIKR